jgi:hypothetical protein
MIQNGPEACEGSSYSVLGTSLSADGGVIGQLLALGCEGITPYITFGEHGDIGLLSAYAGGGVYITDGSNTLHDTNTVGGVWLEQTTSGGSPCGLYDNQVGGGNNGILFGPGGTGFSGTCGLGLPYIGANQQVCTGPATSGVSGLPPYNLQPCSGTTYNTYQSLILLETSMTHDWPMNDSPGGATPGPCPSTIADVVASGATAAPSVENLTVVSSPLPSPAGSPLALQCGVAGPMKGGSSPNAIEWMGQQGIPAYLSVPSPVFETLCKAGGGTCNQPFTLECIVDPANSASYSTSGFTYLWSIDTSTDLSLFIEYPGGGDGIYWYSFDSQNFGAAASGVPVMLDYEFDGASQSYWFINGTLAATKSAAPSMVNSSLSFFGWDGATAGGKYWNGRMQGCSTYNTALSITKIHLHYAATGLP